MLITRAAFVLFQQCISFIKYDWILLNHRKVDTDLNCSGMVFDTQHENHKSPFDNQHHWVTVWCIKSDIPMHGISCLFIPKLPSTPRWSPVPLSIPQEQGFHERAFDKIVEILDFRFVVQLLMLLSTTTPKNKNCNWDFTKTIFWT